MGTIFKNENGSIIAETSLTRFDGGMSNDPRDTAEAKARVVTNFDLLTNPKKLIPYRSSEDGYSSASTLLPQNWTLALRTGTTYSLYALRRQSALNRVAISFKNLTVNADITDLDDNGWGDTANNEGGQATPNYDLFTYYQRTGYIYGGHTGTHIWRYDPDGGDVFANTHLALTYTELTNGIVHSKDDILYFGYYDSAAETAAIVRNNNGTWNTSALALPKGWKPTSICEYGDFIAIAIVPSSSELTGPATDNARVILWDRDSSLNTVYANIPWGAGYLSVLEEVDGELVGISVRRGVGSFTDKMIARIWLGENKTKIIKELSGGRNTTIIPKAKQKIGNRLHFMMLIEFNDAVRDGVWSIGRNDGEWSLAHERTCNNDTALTTGDTIYRFFYFGDYLFQAFLTGGTHTVTKTDDSTTAYSHNSVLETVRFNAGDSSRKKDLVGISITYEEQPTAGQVTVAYRIDQNTSWTTISTDTTDNSLSDSAVNIESSGAALPKDHKEIQFRLISTGGTEITGFFFKERITDKRPYE